MGKKDLRKQGMGKGDVDKEVAAQGRLRHVNIIK